MQQIQFCPKCGGALGENDRFCTHCGFAISTLSTPTPTPTPPQPPPPAEPVRVAPPANNRPQPTSSGIHPALLALVFLIIAGPIGWHIWQKEKDKDNSGFFSPDNTLVDDAKNNSGADKYQQDKPPVIPDVKIPGSHELRDYTGEWRIYEATEDNEMKPQKENPDDDLIIKMENGKLLMYGRSEEADKYNTEINCGSPLGHVLTCRIKNKDENTWMTVTLELSGAKDDLTFTAIPDEPTEKIVIKMRRL